MMGPREVAAIGIAGGTAVVDSGVPRAPKRCGGIVASCALNVSP
jgi:hypothetical protein